MDIRRGLVISAVVTACTFGLGCATPDETDAPTTASEAVPEPMPTAPALPPTEATAPDRIPQELATAVEQPRLQCRDRAC